LTDKAEETTESDKIFIADSIEACYPAALDSLGVLPKAKLQYGD
jgi:hypothetical protein